ncbi:MAG: CdvA-like protein [Candidatus Bathyarchaeia archaeon]|jgi:hypothetical protein
MSQNPNLFLSLGKQVKDEYGYAIGKIASFAVTPSGKFDSVFIEGGDGRISKHSSELLKLEGANVTLTSNIKAQASILCDQIPLIWRKDQALKDLSEKKKISKEMYTELHTSFDGVLTQLKTEAQALTEDIDNEIARCLDETKALNYAFVHLELEHEIGKLDNQSYETAFALVQESLKRVHMEKTDLDLTRGKLSNILLGDQAKNKGIEGSKAGTSASSSPGLPEPPVVVYVKEIGKTGI